MPAALYLQKFGQILYDTFGEMPYQVGSSMCMKADGTWRDVDIRILLSDEDYAREYGDFKQPHRSGRWVGMTMAFSALGKAMTDFQIQQQSHANEKYSTKDGHGRSALFDLTRYASDDRKVELLRALRECAEDPEVKAAMERYQSMSKITAADLAVRVD